MRLNKQQYTEREWAESMIKIKPAYYICGCTWELHLRNTSGNHKETSNIFLFPTQIFCFIFWFIFQSKKKIHKVQRASNTI